MDMIDAIMAKGLGGSGSSGGGGITFETIGEYDNPLYQYTSINTTKSMADYDYLIITTKYTTQWASEDIDVYTTNWAEYVPNGVECIMFATTSASTGTVNVRFKYTANNELTIINGPANTMCITKIVGVKIGA